eukprot:TRINITY_DN7219_c0_g1_i1.p1 TRINITY_DN7219_c0_g1~~TRINITY_DN7219_c0_g1_i1.p1  ORF type:complete len:294 (-),score=71.75 TRINITY_DN7219_c0_g1_i1:4-885(-)
MDVEEEEDQVTCWICFEIFNDAITLNCSHSFCKDCLVKLYKKNPLCAFCRRPFDIPFPPVNNELMKLVGVYINRVKGPKMDDQMLVPQLSPFFLLSHDVICYIFGFLNEREICVSALVCKQLRKVLDDKFLWRELCKRSFPFVNIQKYENNWKRGFIATKKLKRGWNQGKPSDFKMTPLRGHTNYVNCFSFYRNHVVSGSADQSLKIWKTNQEDAVHTLNGHAALINHVTFNELKIVSAAFGAVKIWDTVTGVLTSTLPHAGADVTHVQFDDHVVTSAGNDGMIRLWDTRTLR